MVPFYEIQPSDLTVIHNYREIRFHAHLHEYIEIAYVFKEGQHIDIDGIEYEIKSGQAAVVFPDIVHYYFGMKSDLLMRCWLYAVPSCLTECSRI